MAVDKLVDSTQLNADLTSVANAIRTKGGTSAQLAFPAGFVSAVNAIPSVSNDAVYGTFTPASDLRKLTFSDCIGRSNIFIYPRFDITEMATRVHWGALIVNGLAIMQASNNSAGTAIVGSFTLLSATGSVTNPDTFDSVTGVYTINMNAGSNYGGYFVSGKEYGYVAWGGSGT